MGGYYYGKREAEAAPKAEADPYLLYGGLRTYGYGLGYYGLGHHGYYYGKREAEATPKAEADPYLLYGGYGLGWSSWLRLRSWLQGILLGINYQQLFKT